jgi:hypothetical protein
MVRKITYTYCGSEKRISSDVLEMQRVVQQLTTPKATLITNPEGCEGYLDFAVSNDGTMEMEVFERNDDFATIDVSLAARVIEIAMTDTRNIPLREKLDSLPINWLT